MPSACEFAVRDAHAPPRAARPHDAVQNGIQAKGGSSDIIIHRNRFERIPGRAVNAGDLSWRAIGAYEHRSRAQVVDRRAWRAAFRDCIAPVVDAPHA